MIKVLLGAWASISLTVVLLIVFVKLIVILFRFVKSIIREADRKYFYFGFIFMVLLTFSVLLAIALGY